MKTIISILTVAVLVGCATNQRRPFEHVDSIGSEIDSGFFFARLDIDESFFLASKNWLELEHIDTGERLLIEFQGEGKSVAVKAAPGDYRFIGMVHTPGGPLSWAMESEVTKFPLDESVTELKKTFSVEPGTVYYLGDYYSFQSRDSLMVMGPVISAKFSYGFSFQGYDCDAARLEFTQTFPESNELSSSMVQPRPSPWSSSPLPPCASPSCNSSSSAGDWSCS